MSFSKVIIVLSSSLFLLLSGCANTSGLKKRIVKLEKQIESIETTNIYYANELDIHRENLELIVHQLSTFDEFMQEAEIRIHALDLSLVETRQRLHNFKLRRQPDGTYFIYYVDSNDNFQ